MRSLSKIVAFLGPVLILLGCGREARAMADPVGRDLRVLASRASKRETWPSLRRYAESAKDSERRGLAYFVVGYQEYQAGNYQAATEDLRPAVESRFSLADFAEYYRAAAAREADQLSQAVEALEGFSDRHPESLLRFDALALLARVFLQMDKPQQAIQVLAAEPRVRQRPALTLILAQAFRQAQSLEEAAKAFQEVYYAFPAAPESKAASDALRQLEAHLGANYPRPPEEIQTARVEILFESSRYGEALREYGALLEAHPESPLAGRWRVGRARCLLRLKRARETIEALEGSTSRNPEIDAERLATLVVASVQVQDSTGVIQALDQLRASYPQSPFYASALFSAGSFYARQGDWETALSYFQPLAETFPQTDQGREAHWRVAWAYYLQRDNLKAEQALLAHLTRYPASPHVPAALYWLGRLAEERGTIPQARRLYEFLKKRFVHNYYSLQASLRLKEFPPSPSAEEKSKKLALCSPIPDMAQKMPQRDLPSLSPCGLTTPTEVMRPFLTLRALSLESLAEHYLKTAVADRTTSPDLRLALCQLEAEQRDYSAALLQAKDLVPNFSEYEFSELPKEIWDLLFPQVYWKLVTRQANANRLDPFVILGIIRQESAFNPRATSRANARGLMQVLPRTASRARRGRRAVARKLFDPAYNVRFGCKHLRGLLDAYNGNLAQALAAYNAGEFRVQSWLQNRSFSEPSEFVESIPFSETRVYVEVVLRDADVYRQLMTGSARFRKCD